MVLETAEFFADESDEAYWSFVETWAGGTEPRPRDGATKDEDPDAFFARCASRVRDVAAAVMTAMRWGEAEKAEKAAARDERFV